MAIGDAPGQRAIAWMPRISSCKIGAVPGVQRELIEAKSAVVTRRSKMPRMCRNAATSRPLTPRNRRPERKLLASEEKLTMMAYIKAALAAVVALGVYSAAAHAERVVVVPDHHRDYHEYHHQAHLYHVPPHYRPAYENRY